MFSTGGGLVVLHIQASAFTAVASSFMQTNVLVDGVVVSSLKVFTNEANSHKTLGSRAVVLPALPSGAHTLSLADVAGTHDTNDIAYATVVEYR
jgi:hypothetical protein